MYLSPAADEMAKQARRPRHASARRALDLVRLEPETENEVSVESHQHHPVWESRRLLREAKRDYVWSSHCMCDAFPDAKDVAPF